MNVLLVILLLVVILLLSFIGDILTEIREELRGRKPKMKQKGEIKLIFGQTDKFEEPIDEEVIRKQVQRRNDVYNHKGDYLQNSKRGNTRRAFNNEPRKRKH